MYPSIHLVCWYLICFGIGYTSATSYNQPKLSPTAKWDSNGTIWANSTVIGPESRNIFIDYNDTIYVAASSLNATVIWMNRNRTVARNISNGLVRPQSIFVTLDGDIYIDNGDTYKSVEIRSLNGFNRTIVMNITNSCRSLYIDRNGTLYCSVDVQHQIVKVQLGSNSTSTEIVAGDGQNRSSPWSLNQPKGIFVASNFSLYVADLGNNRIQMFQPGSLNGTTVAGNGASGTIDLLSPVDVALDGNGYLFIVDTGNGRIVRSSPNGFRCIIGCTASDRIEKLKAFSFDTSGNIYVVEAKNSSVKKFTLIDNSFGISYNRPKLCPFARWFTKIDILADVTIVGSNLWGVFVDRNNTVYVMARALDQILIWNEGHVIPTRTIDVSREIQTNIFVTVNGDIYIDIGSNGVHRVEKWSSNGSRSMPVMTMDGRCYGLFVDIYENIYCSRNETNQVLKRSSNDNATSITVIAGNGTRGSGNYTLSSPRGIFVTSKLDLYVADCGNDRIQLFRYGSSIGITVAGRYASGTNYLNCPTSVILDQNGSLFIADYLNHRIVMVNSLRVLCIAGCTSPIYPQAISFDRYGNIYASDGLNDTILKINFASYYCASYNQPLLCPLAAWNSSAITLFNESIVEQLPTSFFVDKNNSIYIPARTTNQLYIQTWTNQTIVKNISNLNHQPWSIFVTITNDIFFGIPDSNISRIEKLPANGNTTIPILNTSYRCFEIFVDIYDDIYCSINDAHQVIKYSIDDDDDEQSITTSIVAGNGTEGSTSYLLAYPRGIFVTHGLYLLVADCVNNRIQYFSPGKSSALTLAGTGANGTIDLNCPTSVVYDSNGYLFITDYYNHRIIGSGPNGFRCIIGCNRINGSSSDQLSYPQTLRFDQVGNIYVADSFNQRIQKFSFNSKSCDTPYNLPKLATCVSWNNDPINVSTNATTGVSPMGLFVNKNNTLYVNARSKDCIFIWPENSSAPTEAISIGNAEQISVFSALNGDIYFDHGTNSLRQIFKWVHDRNDTLPVMIIRSKCHGLFIDFSDNIYCSMAEQHQVVRRRASHNINITSIIAGTGTAGAATNTLSSPRGIFITTNFDLYVADCGNNRVQKFRYEERDATTVFSRNNDINLTCPTSVIVDASNNLFIASSDNRIIRYGTTGQRCIIGCDLISGSLFPSIHQPNSISFDSYGNLFVAHNSSNTIVKFLLRNDTCGYTTSATSAKTTLFTFQTTSERPTSFVTSDYHHTTSLQPSVPFTCHRPFYIGPACNISIAPCHLLQPCQNNATCIDNQNISIGYLCLCPPRFNGTQCELDQRPCQPRTCRNDGICNETSTTTFRCHCPLEWTGDRCETKIDFCKNVTCLNNGVCRPLVGDYRCECVDKDYSGRHCEVTPTKLVIRKNISKSFGYVAIVSLLLVMLFIVVLDMLKYIFGIDVGAKERRLRGGRKGPKKVRVQARARVIEHFVYVN